MSLDIKDLMTIHEALNQAYKYTPKNLNPEQRGIRKVRVFNAREKIAKMIEEIL